MGDILGQLAERHAKDTWVPECMLGAAGSQRMDGWAMLSTWSPMTTIGYEIKHSRNDFIRDNKWPNYLPCCHQFYWVCPSKVISPAEVPDGCGLIYAGARLLTKVKAPRREPDPKRLIAIMTYILMWRSREQKPERNADHWRRWLAEKRDRADIGRAVGVALKAEVKRYAHEAQEAKDRAKRVEEGAAAFREALKASGLDPDAGPWRARADVRKLVAGDLELREDLARRARELFEILERLAKA